MSIQRKMAAINGKCVYEYSSNTYYIHFAKCDFDDNGCIHNLKEHIIAFDGSKVFHKVEDEAWMDCDEAEREVNCTYRQLNTGGIEKVSIAEAKKLMSRAFNSLYWSYQMVKKSELLRRDDDGVVHYPGCTERELNTYKDFEMKSLHFVYDAASVLFYWGIPTPDRESSYMKFYEMWIADDGHEIGITRCPTALMSSEDNSCKTEKMGNDSLFEKWESSYHRLKEDIEGLLSGVSDK